MKIPKPIHSMRIEPYGWLLVLFDDKADFNAYRKAVMGGHPSEDVTVECGRCTTRTDMALILVGAFKSDKDGSSCMPGTLAHELSHGILHMFDHIGLPVTDQSSEAFCYMLAHLFDPCFEALYRNWRWVKRKRAKRR